MRAIVQRALEASCVVDGKIVRMGPEMQATRWSAINTFFKFLIMDSYIDTNPMRWDKDCFYVE